VIVIGHQEIDGVPYINGKRAIHDPPGGKSRKIALLDGAFSEYRCPECNARLGGNVSICLNACHLSAASYARFMARIRDAQAAVARDKHREQMVAEGNLVDAVGDLVREQERDT